MVLWFLIMVLAIQDVESMKPEPVNAHIFLNTGERIELADARVKGSDPYMVEMRTEEGKIFVSLLRVTRITTLEARRYEVVLDDGSTLMGSLDSFALEGHPVENPSEAESHNIRHIKRIHFILGNQLRSCLEGHYEAYTPHPFCPVCGKLLTIGPFPEGVPEGNPRVAPLHLLRSNSRN
jgi:hypothetical protein